MYIQQFYSTDFNIILPTGEKSPRPITAISSSSANSYTSRVYLYCDAGRTAAIGDPRIPQKAELRSEGHQTGTGTKTVIESPPSSWENSLFRSRSLTNFFLSRRQVRDKPGFRKPPLSSPVEVTGYPVIELAKFFKRGEYFHRR